MQADFVVLHKNAASPAVIVETRARKNTNTDWAREFAEQVVSAYGLSQKPFFVLATLDNTYIWSGLSTPVPAPSCTIDTERLIGTKLTNDSEIPITPESFEMLIQGWLKRVLAAEDSSTSMPSELRILGLGEAINNGSLLASD